MARRSRGSGRRTVHIEIDKQGDLSSAVAKGARVCLHLAPGSCLLRTLNVGGMSAKEVEPALALMAEASLPLPPDQYYTDSWAISTDVHGLAAVPRESLEHARQQLLAAGAKPIAVRVPELRPPLDSKPTLVLSVTPGGLLACLWREQVLYHWQIFPPQIDRQAVIDQLLAAAESPPELILVGWMRFDRDPWPELESAWPQSEVRETWNLNVAQKERTFGPGPQLGSYLFEEQLQSATSGDKLRLGLALCGAVFAGLFMFFAEVGYLERQAEQLRHSVSLLKVKANRSEKVAARSGQTLRQIREVKAMTVERRGILDVLKSLNDALPPRVKLERISVERGGATALDGVAETELDVSNFLEKLGQTPLIGEPRLTFTQKEDAGEEAQALIRFRLEARLIEPLLSVPSADREESAAAPAERQTNAEAEEA